MGQILAFSRLLIFALITMLTTIVLMLARLVRAPQRFNFRVFGLAVKGVRFFLRIRVNNYGHIPAEYGVIMSNHRSYIDAVLIPSKVPYVIVAKKQVRSWPVIGWVGIALKAIFVDRDSVSSRRDTRAAIRDRLQGGFSVLIFPEGTTHRGPDILPFKPGMFTTCAEAGFKVIPVAIEYENQDMAWIGNDTFVPHFMQTFCHRRVRVSVSFGAPLSGNDAAVLRESAENWVRVETKRLRNLWDSNES